MPKMESRLLLPNLPSELRNIIYANTICPSQPATSTGLPFTSKAFPLNSHTKVVITPVHYGNPNLLALERYRFQEASEYRTYLFSYAIQLRILVHFNGYRNTFVQEHWDKKISTHLKNIVEKFPWLTKVMDYDVQIRWEPKTRPGWKQRRDIGAIATRMVEVLSGMMDEDLKRKRSVMRAELQIGLAAAYDYVCERQPLGLAEFVFPENDMLLTHTREIRIAPSVCRCHDAECGCQAKGHSVFKREVERKSDGTIVRCETAKEPIDVSRTVMRVFKSFVEECSCTMR